MLMITSASSIGLPPLEELIRYYAYSDWLSIWRWEYRLIHNAPGEEW